MIPILIPYAPCTYLRDVYLAHGDAVLIFHVAERERLCHRTRPPLRPASLSYGIHVNSVYTSRGIYMVRVELEESERTNERTDEGKARVPTLRADPGKVYRVLLRHDERG